MAPLVVYLLKMTACSGILFAYYRMALYNRTFHQWNRIYLLVSVAAGLVVPLIRINVLAAEGSDPLPVSRLLDIVTVQRAPENEGFMPAANASATTMIICICYVVISLILIGVLLQSLARIRRLIREHTVVRLDNIFFLNTKEKDAPFSFFRYIFWNECIDPHSNTGMQILNHEKIHVAEGHSGDRLFMNVVTAFFWCNPFFWLIRKELTLLHEFIADQRTVGRNDVPAFAQMILATAFPKQPFGVTSNFSSSSIKRRILMLKKTNPSASARLGRLFMIPVLCVTVAVLTLSNKPVTPRAGPDEPAGNAGRFTVIIDAGHGGADNGAVSPDGTLEKNITLLIAKKILQLNTNKDLDIRLTRSQDITQTVREKVDLAVEAKPDAFISIHVGADMAAGTGFDFYVTNKKSGYLRESQLLGTLLSSQIGKIYPVAPELKKRQEAGIWVLDAPAINYPSILVECGSLTDKKDLSFILDPQKQDQVALKILKALEVFAAITSDAPTVR